MSIKCSCGASFRTLEEFKTHRTLNKAFRGSCLTHILDIGEKVTISLINKQNKFSYKKVK